MNKLKELFGVNYDNKFGCIKPPLDMFLRCHYDGDSWTIEYSVADLDIEGKHLHSRDLNDGVRNMIQDILEHCIWASDE